LIGEELRKPTYM